MLIPWKKSYDKPRQKKKKKSRDVTLLTKVHLVKAMVEPVLMYEFSSSHVWIWELDLKESWAPKNLCFWTVMLEKNLESPLDSKIKSVNPKGNQPWIFIGRTKAEAEASILWPPDVKSWLIGKDPDAGKDWRQEEKGMTTYSAILAWSIPWTEEPGGLQSMGSQRVEHNWMTNIFTYLWKMVGL